MPDNTAIAYDISRQLHQHCSGRAILEASNEWFDLQQFAADGHCTVCRNPEIHSLVETKWTGPGEGLTLRDRVSWHVAQWRGHALEVVAADWKRFPHEERWQWIITADIAVARAFYDAVCEWCMETRGEVLVYSGGSWESKTWRS